MPGRRNFAAELRDECLNGEIFYSLKEATVVRSLSLGEGMLCTVEQATAGSQLHDAIVSIPLVQNIRRVTLTHGAPYGNRTRVSAVKGSIRGHWRIPTSFAG